MNKAKMIRMLSDYAPRVSKILSGSSMLAQTMIATEGLLNFMDGNNERSISQVTCSAIKVLHDRLNNAHEASGAGLDQMKGLPETVPTDAEQEAAHKKFRDALTSVIVAVHGFEMMALVLGDTPEPKAEKEAEPAPAPAAE